MKLSIAITVAALAAIATALLITGILWDLKATVDRELDIQDGRSRGREELERVWQEQRDEAEANDKFWRDPHPKEKP